MLGYIALIVICFMISLFSPQVSKPTLELLTRIEFLEKTIRELKFRYLSQEMDSEIENKPVEPLLKQVNKKEDTVVTGSYNAKIRLYTPLWNNTTANA